MEMEKEQPPKKKAGRPKGSPNKKKKPSALRANRQKNLPPPVEVNGTRQANEHPRQEESLLPEALRNLLSSQESKRGNPMPDADAPGSATPSDGYSGPDAPLGEESERILSSVPPSIGESGTSGPEAPIPFPSPQDPISALMAQVAFEPQDVQDVMAEAFDWLAERFESDHWKLTERQARMLGRPTAQLLNSMWARLAEFLPGILSRWCEETPGATAFILAASLIVVPKVARQVTISRERQKADPRGSQTSAAGQKGAHPQPVPPRPKEGIVFEPGIRL
jgi:hypothetical protein